MRSIAVTMLFCVSLSANGQKARQAIENGNDLYKQKQFAKAKGEYRKALQKDNANAVAHFNSGNASQRMNQFGEASKSYEQAATVARDPLVQAQAFYNQGIAYLKQKKLTEAIDAFKKSLRIYPGDNDARENLQKALKELKQQQQKKDDKQDDKNKKKPKDKDQPKPPKTKLSKEEADKMLNNLQKEEKNLQKQVQKKSQSARQLKDW